MTGLTRRIYRERRRLAFVVTLATLAGFLFYSHLPHYIGGIHISWITALMYGGFVGTATLAVCLVFPAFRFAMEAFAVSRLAFASAVASYPALGAMTVNSPFINATIVVAGGALVSLVFYSDWLGRRAVRRGLVSQTRLRGTSPARRLPETPDLERLCYSPAKPGAQRALHDLVTGAAMADADTEGRLQVRHDALPLRTFVAAWLDDAFGRVADLAGEARAADPVAEPAFEKAAAA